MIFGTSFESKFDDVAPVTDFKTYSLDAILARLPRVNYQLDAYLVAWPIHTYFASGRIGIPSPSYLADAIIAVDQADPRLSDSFINVLYWAFANEYRLAAQAIDLLELRMKLDFANTTDLDEYWGKLLGLRRKANELDTSYRARLATRIRVITSSGTKSNCQTVIDRIIDAPGGSNLETYYPASVVLTWNNPSAIEKAVLNETLISDAMGKMLAAGISWSTTYPLATYNMEFTRSYTDYASYSMNSSATKKRGVVYRANAGIWESGSKNYNMIGFLYSKEIMSYVIKGTKEATLHASYLADSMLIDLIGASKIADYDMTGYASKIVKRGYSADGIVEAS